MTETDAFLILNAISGLGNARIQTLTEHFSSAQAVLQASYKDLSSSGILSAKIIQKILDFPQDDFLKKEYNFLRKYNINTIIYNSNIYPELLKAIPDAPVVLYSKGSCAAEDQVAVAVVGSRRASIYGLNMADKFGRELAELGITVVSGMARGIDTAAHRGALKANGRTIAVVGCGLTRVYPPENQRIFAEIGENGVVFSEFPMTMPPLAQNFPRRNRIISGLSLGVVVVEASQKSGALITGDMALEQGREVFAVPGHIDQCNSQGVHRLIQQGAKLVHGVDDILEELKFQLVHRKKENDSQDGSQVKNQKTELSEEENQIFHLMGHQPVHVDQLRKQSSFLMPKIMNILLQLELKQCVRQLPGKVFTRHG